MKFYAGIGSRQTPRPWLDLMETMASVLARQGYTLRSGAAEGADTAFEHGAYKTWRLCADAPMPEIYAPWEGFGEGRAGLPTPTRIAVELPAEAAVIARRNHPAWHTLKRPARWLHTRNVAQVLGEDCHTPVDFVLCWTPGGSGKGGTGQALRIAREANIPVYDMGGLAMPYIRSQLHEKFGVDL